MDYDGCSCATGLVRGPRELLNRQTSAENTVNIEFSGSGYLNESATFPNRETIFVDYNLQNSYKTTFLLLVSLAFQILSMIMVFMLLIKKPRYIPTGDGKKCVHIYNPTRTYQSESDENTLLKDTRENLHCEPQDYI